MLEISLSAALVIITLLYTLVTFLNLRAMEREHDRSGMLELFSFMEKFRDDREMVRSYVRDGRSWENVYPPQVLAIDRLCRSYEILGFIHRRKLVKPELIDEMYSTAFVPLYDEFLKDYVDYKRRPDQRGTTHFYELTQFYERVKEKDHPSGERPHLPRIPAEENEGSD
jgi:hypothetical protein